MFAFVYFLFAGRVVWMSRVVLHADLNNFYASVACLERP